MTVAKQNFSWNSATSYSPRCSPMRWIRHWRRTWGNLTKYNVGRWLENDLEEEPDGIPQRKSPRHRLRLFLCGIRQRPTLPDRLQPSTIGAERLNFCVRHGNRWIPFAIVTGNRIGFFAYPENRTSRLLTSRITSFPIFPLVSTQFF